ncbi:Protein of unknown function [Micrococcales bacterium KH10]|nr:Protein of unknown function [Micrococcales bacterium KH10]
MIVTRPCSRSACGRPAVATLTYVYADSTAVLGPLAMHAEPHSYDLCAQHAERLTAPRGWEVVRLALPEQPEPSVDELVPSHMARHSSDDLTRVVEAVREPVVPRHKTPEPAVQSSEISRRGHLRMLRGDIV